MKCSRFDARSTAFSGLARAFCAVASGTALLLSLSDVASARPRDPITSAETDLRISEMKMRTVEFPTRPPETAVDGYDDCVENSTEVLVVDPVSGDRRKQIVSLWLPQPLKKPSPAVVIVPTIEGRWFVEDRVARWLCSAGIIGVIADVNEPMVPKVLPDWPMEDRMNRNSMLALQTILDWAASDSRVDSARLGAVGISLGAITTSLWLGIEPRLKAGMVVAGGGNIPEMLTVSTQRKISELRTKRMRAAHLKSAHEYEETLHGSVRFDPLYFASRAPAKLKMISGTADDTVAYADQTSLWEAFGKPERLVLSGEAHIGSILTWAYWHMGESIEWFQKQLN